MAVLNALPEIVGWSLWPTPLPGPRVRRCPSWALINVLAKASHEHPNPYKKEQ